MSNMNDFVIENGILKKYNGTGGDVVIPDGVTKISWFVFKGCTALTSVTIPDSVTSIGNRAFEYCTGLTSVTIPDSVTSVGSDAFADTGYFNDPGNWQNGVLYIGNHLIKAKKSLSENYEIRPGTVCIADFAFEGCISLTKIIIPNSVTSIGSAAFEYCTGLTSVTIPDSVTRIGDSAFKKCTELTSVTIPNSVTSIGNSAFVDCHGLTSLTIPDSVTSIGDSAFYRAHIKRMVFPKKKIEVGQYAFDHCIVNEAFVPLDVEWSLPAAFADFNIPNTSPQELAYVALFQSGASWKAFLNRQVKSDNINQVLSTFLVLSQKKKKLKKSVIDNLEAVCSAAPKSVTPKNAAAVCDLLSKQNPAAAERLRKIPGLFDAPTEQDIAKEKAIAVFSGKTFVLTGLANESEVADYIVSLGGVVRTSVSPNTDCLIYNAKYPYKTKKYIEAKSYAKRGSLKKLTCAELKELLQRNGIVPDGCLDKAEELFDLSTPESSFREYKKTVSINMRGMESAQVDLRHSEIYREVVFDGELHKEQSKWVVEALSLYSLTDLWNEMTDCSDLRIFNGYSAQAPIAVLLAVRWFSNPDFSIKFRVYRDKWEERGDYPGMSNIVPPAVYWEINDRYPYGRWSCEQYDRATSSYVAEED